MPSCDDTLASSENMAGLHMTIQDNENFDSRAFRNAMGSFATGVTVVTMAKSDGSLKAMTANAFSSVSLEPPMLLVCIDKGASMHEWLDHVSAFGVNILSGEQQHVSNVFASSGTHPEPLSGIPHTIGPLGVPVINDVMLWASCKIIHKYPAGDHTILVGQVEGLENNQAINSPLLFHSGKYHQLGEEM
jgi:flavin reductase (DIM6/NTAB) family NADH-FMN oxidoreductase RutF